MDSLVPLGLVGAALAALLVIATAQAPDFWEGRSLDRFRSLMVWWPYSNAFREGFLRAMPIGIVGAWAMEVGGLAVILLRLGAGRFATWLLVTGLGAAVLCTSVSLLIVAFNRPKAVVPPPLREQEGLLQRSRILTRTLCTGRDRTTRDRRDLALCCRPLGSGVGA